MNLFKACADWLSAHTLSALAAIGRETWDFLAGIKAAVFSIPWRIAAWLAGIGFAVANIPIRIKGLFGDVRRDGLSAALEIRHNDKRRRQVALARRDQPPRRLADEPTDDFPTERRPLWKRMVVGLFVFIGRTLATVAVSLVVTGCIVGITALLFVLTKLDRDPGFDINQIKINYASVIFVQNPATGEYDEFKKLHASENREWVDYDQIPQSMKDAVVSIEDKRFWEHNGVDWRRTGFALINMFTNQREDQGGSTVTQQLIKNVTKEDEVSIDRKLTEIFRALQLERHCTKEQILEAYLNVIALGNGCNGVKTAAMTYFGKDISEIDIAESACLAGITKNPSQFNPLYRPEKNKERQEYVLECMAEQYLITPEEYTGALEQVLVFNEDSIYNPDTKSANNWYIDQIIFDLFDELQTKCGYSSSQARFEVYNGGLKIYSCMDLALQNRAQAIYNDWGASNFGYYSGAVKPESAIVVMNYQGAVKAIVGRRGEKQGDMIHNLASQARRQPGSSMKPLSAYGPAVEFGMLEYSTPVPNAPISLGGKSWPKNSGYSSYTGQVLPVVKGLEISANCVAVRVAREITPTRSFAFMTERLGLKLISEKKYFDGIKGDINLSAALGGLTEGVTVMEMAAAYAVFGNEGKYYKPYTYSKVVDATGRTIITHGEGDGIPAMSFESATIMNHLVRAPLGGIGTATAARFTSLPTFGKTGTTSENKDRYFCGGTPYYVAACWFGFEKIQRPLGNTPNYAMQTWRRVMVAAHEGLPTSAQFPFSPNVYVRRYCTISGGIAGSGCPTGVGYYAKGSSMPMCPLHAGGRANSAYSRYLDNKSSFQAPPTSAVVSPAPTADPTSPEPTTQAPTTPQPTAGPTDPPQTDPPATTTAPITDPPTESTTTTTEEPEPED